MNTLHSFLLFLSFLTPKQSPPPLPPIDVKAFEVQAHTIPADFEFVGVAKSSHPVEIRARVEGYLDSINYLEGSLVHQGDLLFQIDPREFEASVQEAKGALARQEAILWRARRSLERIQPLFEKNAASQRDLDNATAEVLAAEASVLTAEGNLIKAELNLSYTHITSPVDGMSGRAIYQVGSLITPSINGLLTYVSILDPIWVYFNITNSELLQVRTDRTQENLVTPSTQNYTVTLTLSDGSQFPCVGKVNFNSPILDPKTGTMSVRAQFSNPGDTLLPGQFVKAKVLGAYRPNALLIPQTAVFQGSNGMQVFVINSDNTLTKRSVKTGAWFESYWVVSEGLQVGEKIIADGVNRIDVGSKIHVISTACYEGVDYDEYRAVCLK